MNTLKIATFINTGGASGFHKAVFLNAKRPAERYGERLTNYSLIGVTACTR